MSRRRPPPAASPGLQPRATGCPGGRRGSEDREGRGAACPPRPLLRGHRAPFPHFLRVREVRRPPRCASDGFCTACVTAFLLVADTLPPCTRRVPPPSAEFFLQTPHWPPARPVCAFAQTSPSQEGLPCCSVRPAPPNILSASPSHSPHVLIIFTRYQVNVFILLTVRLSHIREVVDFCPSDPATALAHDGSSGHTCGMNEGIGVVTEGTVGDESVKFVGNMMR